MLEQLEDLVDQWSSEEISWREICLDLLLRDQRGPVLLDLYFSTWSTTTSGGSSEDQECFQQVMLGGYPLIPK